MPDTQWPRYVVFHQPRQGAPHEYAGSVHAPDAELALMNARDVFVRRPDCVSLWVVRADKIFSKTAEELALDAAWLDAPVDTSADSEEYRICKKIGHKGISHVVGSVLAASPPQALKTAIHHFPEPEPLVWWVFPTAAICSTDPEDSETLFGHAWSKTAFRDQSEFHTVALLKQLRGKLQEANEDE